VHSICVQFEQSETDVLVETLISSADLIYCKAMFHTLHYGSLNECNSLDRQTDTEIRLGSVLQKSYHLEYR
jgi:hypothetical protein